MNAADLASFIDSTLFESDDEDATLERAAKPPTDLEQTVQRPPDDPTLRALPFQPARPAQPETDLERTVQSAPTEPVVEAASARIEPTERTEHASPSVIVAPGAGARDLRRIAMRALPYALCVVAGLAVGHAVRRSPAPPPVVAPPPAAPPPLATDVARPAPPPAAAKPEAPAEAEVKPAPAAAKPETPAEAEAKPAPAARAEPAEAPAPPVQERHAPAAHAARGSDVAGGCQVNVVTEPPEARIAWRGKPLGVTPLAEASIPCGEGTLTITHERYETVSKPLTAESGVPVAVDERLHRPPATLIVNSIPQGASLSVNGHAVGSAPRRVPTMRYEHLTIRATFPGYAPWTKKVYLTGDTMQVTAQLSGGRKR
jgi:hypothetical protein